jgi:hypothetical protein
MNFYIKKNNFRKGLKMCLMYKCGDVEYCEDECCKYDIFNHYCADCKNVYNVVSDIEDSDED